ncbi:MAG: putative glycoside hydrolase [Gemmatimonadota bacterium]
MKRRDFVSTATAGALGLGVLGSAAFPSSISGCFAPARTDFSGWLWIGRRPEKSPAEWQALFSRLRDAGFRGILVGGAFDPALADAAHSADLEYHRWMWILNRAGDTWAQENHPEWFTVSRNGDSTLDVPPYVDYYRWVCPSRAPVREYLSGVIDEAAAQPGLDGIHLDYIRYPDVILPRGLWERYDLVQDRELPEYDFCYCDECREQFGRLSGRDPLELDDPPSDPDWARFRWDSVTRVVTELSEVTHARGRSISAAVFATPALARKLVRQAWDEWPVDRLFPMLYHPAYDQDIPWIGRSVEEGLRALDGSGTELNAGLYLPALAPDELAEAIRLSRQAGGAGFSLFDINPLTDDHITAVEATMREPRPSPLQPAG